SQQLFPPHALQNVTCRARLERLEGLHTSFIGRQDDDACSLKLAANLCNGLDTTSAWHLQVHQRDVGMVLTKALDGLSTIRNFGNQTHIRLCFDDRSDP